MAQQDYTIDNATGAAVRADINANLQAVATNNSGSSEPTPTFAYQWWSDTTAGKLKVRNGSNTSWVEVGDLDNPNLGLMRASYFPNINNNITATDEELNKTDGLTATTTELNLLSGKTALPNVEDAYPIGSIYMNASNSANPSSLLGFGTWVAFGAGRVLVGLDSGQSEFDSIGETGGSKTHTLTEAEMPSHNHTHKRYGVNNSSYTGQGSICNSSATDTTSTAGGDQAHNNLQPYITVYMWKRIA